MPHMHLMEILTRHFGLIVAFLLPGFVALAGVALLLPDVAIWLRADQSASIGAPLYVLLAATDMGMIVSCFRWLLVDRMLEWAGMPAASFDPQAVGEHLAVFNLLVSAHYQFFLFYSNTLIAIIWSYGIWCWGHSSRLGSGTTLGVLVLCVVLFAGSRDALRKHRDRSFMLFSSPTSNFSTGEPMTNGIDHNIGNGGKASDKPPTAPKSGGKPETSAKPKPEKGDKGTGG